MSYQRAAGLLITYDSMIECYIAFATQKCIICPGKRDYSKKNAKGNISFDVGGVFQYIF